MTTKGKIQVKYYAGLGATALYLVQNAGGAGSTATFHFLRSIARHMDTVRVSEVATAHAIRAPRLVNFRAFAAAQGFEVVD